MVIVLGPLGAKTAHAGLFDILDVPGRAVKYLAAWAVNLILTIVSQLLTIAGYIFENAITYSIGEQGKGSPTVIKEGWTITRDIVNMFFIFILLYIAIATILQVSGYGMKDLLVRVIIIALLVNFSLMITRVIIDASNILAMEFYNTLMETKDEKGKTVSLSSAIVGGINPQTLFDQKALTEKKITDPETGETTKIDLNDEGTLVQIIIIGVFGIVLILVTTFVLFAAAILFMIRTAILWILMILSPLAFLAMALPATKQYASKWWEKLFNQAFFAPAYLFLFLLVVKIVAKGEILKQLGAENATFGTAFGSPNNANVNLILNFIILIVLMVACLIIAKQMGAYGAGTVMKWGQSAKKWGQGYAGRVGKRYVGRAATAAEGALEKGEGKFAKTLKAMPFLQRGLAGVAQLKKKEVGKYEKQYEKYDLTTLEQLQGKRGTTPEAREAMGKLITKKRAQEAKKEDVKKENERYDKIVGTKEKNYEDGELPYKEAWYEKDKQRKIGLEVELKSNELKMAQNPSDEELQKKRIQLAIEKDQIEERIKDVNQMREEKKKTEENRARRREIEGLEEEIAKVKAGVEGAKKPKEAGPGKTPEKT